MSRSLNEDIKLLKAGDTVNTFIYVLVDPRNGDVRYVGKSDNPNKRLVDHIRKSNNSITHKNNWIKSLIKDGYEPLIDVIDEVPNSNWGFWEQYWIDLFKGWGFDLTNIANGGVGGNLGPVVNKKISDALKGRVFSDEAKLKMSIGSTGKIHTDKTKEKMSRQRSGIGNSMYGKIRKESSKKYRPVIQLDLDGNIIDKWDGVTIASKTLNINRCTISDVCNGRKKTAGGFKWKYNG